MLFVLLIIGVVLFAAIVLFAVSTLETRHHSPNEEMKISLPEDISTKRRVVSERLKSRSQGAA
jgi:Zn-dependent membrane protease YugP